MFFKVLKKTDRINNQFYKASLEMIILLNLVATSCQNDDMHCVKSVRIQSFSGPFFLAFLAFFPSKKYRFLIHMVFKTHENFGIHTFQVCLTFFEGVVSLRVSLNENFIKIDVSLRNAVGEN